MSELIWNEVTKAAPKNQFVLAYFGENSIQTVEFEVYNGKLYCWDASGESFMLLPSHWANKPSGPLK